MTRANVAAVHLPIAAELCLSTVPGFAPAIPGRNPSKDRDVVYPEPRPKDTRYSA